MDFEKYLKFGTEYLSEYLWVLFMTLKNPVLRFAPISEAPSNSNILALPNTIASFKSGTRQDPKLISFALISILIGLSLETSLTGTLPFEITTLVLFYVLSWLIFSFCLHLFCKILKGKGTYIETISVSFQLLSTLYVVGNLAAFLGKIIVNPIIDLTGWQTISPEYIFYISILLSAIYFPIALTHVHKFKVLNQILLGAVIFIGIGIWVIVCISIYSITQLFIMPV